MGAPTITFSKLVDRLHRYYGSPPLSPSTDPLELIIWENIAYLASDEHRAGAFATLKRTIGIRPEQILAAKHSALAAIGKAGILPDVSAEKLLKVAKIAYEEFGSDLRSVLKKPLPRRDFPASAIRVPKRYSCSPVPIHSWHSTRMVCGCYVEWVSPRSRRTIQRHIGRFRTPYGSNSPRITIR